MGRSVGCYHIDIDIPLTIYAAGGTGGLNFGNASATQLIYDKLMILKPQGATSLPGSIIIDGRMSYRPTVSLPILNTNVNTKYKVDEDSIPFNYGFGEPYYYNHTAAPLSTFAPTITLNSIKNTLGGVE